LGLAIQTWELLMILLLLARKVVLRQRQQTAFALVLLRHAGISPLVIHGIENIEPTLAFSMPFGTFILAWVERALNRMRKLDVVAERTALICAAFTASVFLISGVVYLYLGRLPVTHLDFWRIYDFCLNHTWLESALLKHNGHSLFFPSLIWLADLRFFHGSQQLLFYVGLTLLFIATGLLLVPVWRDQTIELTGKVISTLIVIVGTFWMGRANITASGGYNCTASLLMAGAEVSFICLPSMGIYSARSWVATFAVIAGGFVASFSFGAGLATWPTLLLLAWCLRLPWRTYGLIIVAAVIAAVIFILLPPRESTLVGLRTLGLSISGIATDLSYLCRLLSAPIFHAASRWRAGPPSTGLIESSFFALAFGMVALIVAIVEIVYTMIRRDLSRSSLGLIGIALVIFNLIVLGLVVVGRAEHFRALPFELGAPRYFFHSTLFWTGGLLVALQRAESSRWARWLIYLWVFAASIAAFPSHYKGGLNCKAARHRADAAATSLINGVRDDQEIRILGPAADINWVYRVAEQLRQRRLDMFADGLQDWIGLGESNLFGGRRKPEKLKGRCAVTALVQCDNGAPAARVVGQASKDGGRIPKTLVIVDPTGVVRGVARSSPTSPFVNRAFYLGKVKTGFLGYIRDYNPQLGYSVRSADDRTLSEEKIPVQVGMTKPAKR
jgi:hypothetical protein